MSTHAPDSIVMVIVTGVKCQLRVPANACGASKSFGLQQYIYSPTSPVQSLWSRIFLLGIAWTQRYIMVWIRSHQNLQQLKQKEDTSGVGVTSRYMIMILILSQCLYSFAT